MTNAFEAVQQAAQTRYAATTIDSQELARRIVTAAQGDMRVAYDFLDTLTAHVSQMLREARG